MIYRYIADIKQENGIYTVTFPAFAGKGRWIAGIAVVLILVIIALIIHGLQGQTS